MKKKALFIGEKPSLTTAASNVYKKHMSEIEYDITFKKQAGHLMTLLYPDEIDSSLSKWSFDTLPFFAEDYGGYKYKVIERTKNLYDEIKRELRTGDYDYIIHAGDSDREGELLVRLTLNSLGNKLPVLRFWENGMDEYSLLNALKNLRNDNEEFFENLYQAALARQHTDYLYGMNCSRACSLSMHSNISVGRVETTIQSIVVKRDDEINNFKPHTNYQIVSNYKEGFNGILFNETEASADKKKTDEDSDEASSYIRFESAKEANDFINTLNNFATVKEYKEAEVKQYAPKLLHLATAQIAGNKFGYNSDMVLQIIQTLYEKKIMSYPRTDCPYLLSHSEFDKMIEAVKCVPELKPYADEITPADISRIKSFKKYVNDEEVKKGGHYALSPTGVKFDYDSLSKPERDMVYLIFRQFIAIFLPPVIQNKVLIVTENNGNSFKTNGKTLVDKGYSTIFGTKYEDIIIPKVKKGDVVNVNKFEVTPITSVCPKPYTDGTLIQALENPLKYLNDDEFKKLGKELKIGTSATRSSTIKKLIETYKYLYRESGKTGYIHATEVGTKIIRNLENSELTQVDMTAIWTEKLTLIRDGRYSRSQFEKEAKESIIEFVELMKTTIKHKEELPSSFKGKTTIEKICTCPKCGKDIIKFDWGYGCSGYKDGCKVSVSKGLLCATFSDKDVKDLIAGKSVCKTLKKDSSSWKQDLKLDLDTGKLVFVSDTSESKYLCPCCKKNNLIEESSKFTCSCGYKLYKSAASKTLSVKNMKDLLTKGSTEMIKGFVSRKGTTFSAKLVMDDKGVTHFEFK